ncbi:universal stress protein [Lichenibacterium dinghuense]|uniref:universal stress protein n=1 Tax=Lichenibacterium dinghuense TaxID=2895977 RepID=UPI001F2DFF52|nr:universal stress protein [Lichenibacterium sp. 6Y81]
MCLVDMVLCVDSTTDSWAVSLNRAVDHAAALRAHLAIIDVAALDDAVPKTDPRTFDLDMEARTALRGKQVDGRLIHDGSDGASWLDHVQASDLILASPDDRAYPAVPSFLPTLLRSSGVPVLLEPEPAQGSLPGRRILVPWTADRACARALHDCLPLLRRAEEVTLLHRRSDGHAPRDCVEGVSDHLARHGIRSRVEWTEGADALDSHELTSRASRSGADLIVLGLGGPSHWPQPIIPGPIDALLHRSQVALFLSP